jgi:hypothetical protein
MTLDASGNLGVGATSSLKKLTVKGSTTDRTVEVIDDGSNDAAIMLQLSGVQEFTLGVDRTDSSFRIADGGALGSNDRLVIDSSGQLLVGKTTTAATVGGGVVYLGKVDAARDDGDVATFKHTTAGNTVGSISISSILTTYNTTSDYRLKTVIGPVANAGQRIDALQPIEYTWNSNGSRTRGFLAHQFQEVYASSVSGTKDAVDAEGKPVYQSMQASTSEVIADLVAEIQDLRKRLAAAGI